MPSSPASLNASSARTLKPNNAKGGPRVPIRRTAKWHEEKTMPATSLHEDPPVNPAVTGLDCPCCPRCGEPIAPRLRLVVERLRQAAKRPVVPEILHACDCGELFVVSLRPGPGR